jgi:hypothetical protein
MAGSLRQRQRVKEGPPEEDLEPMRLDDVGALMQAKHGTIYLIDGVVSLALVFGASETTSGDPPAEIVRDLEAALRGSDGRLKFSGWYESEELSSLELQFALLEHLVPARPFSSLPTSLYLLGIQVSEDRALGVIERLQGSASFVGYCDIGWPTELRTILQDCLEEYWP